jgi:UDP-4-amino-4,6-dideoxy-N-acetyl-beta-L-altrosamine N-acetyltransferase
MTIDKNKEYQHGNLTFVNYIHLDESDLITILEYRNHPRVRKMTHNSIEISIEDHLNFIKKLKFDDSNFYFAIKKNHKIIGSVSLTKCDFITKYILAGVFLDPKLIGSGLGVELEFESIRLAFVTFKIEKAGCEIFEENNFSHTIIPKFGFKTIATYPSYIVSELSREDWLKLPATYIEFKYELLQSLRKNK